MTIVLVAAIALALVAVSAAVAAALVVAVRRRMRRGNEVVPGHPSPAPGSWARAHRPEAVLHRRLRDAMAALRTMPDIDGPSPGTAAELDRYALALDHRIVAVAAVPERVRGPALARVTEDVEAIESAVGNLATQVGAGSHRRDEAIRALIEHVARLDEARAEIDALDAGAVPPPPRDT